jgi:hypothetical protein
LEQDRALQSLWVDLSGIDERPGACCMSFGFDLNPLQRSIGKVGLVNQPFVARGEKGGIQVVAGYRRLLALKKLLWEKVRCWDLSHLSLQERLLFNFYDNHATRGFNDVEISMALSRLVTHFSKEEILREYMPLLGLPSHGETLDCYLALEALDHPIKAALVQKALSLRALRPLLHMDDDTRKAVIQWMLQFNFNFNQQRQAIEYIIDICDTENKKARALLGEEDFGTPVKDVEMNTPQKAKQVIDRLRARCHPRLTKAEQVFRNRVSRLGLPDGAVIKHPPFFEDPHYRLEIAFRNGKGLAGKLKVLVGLEGLQNIGDPWTEG